MKLYSYDNTIIVYKVAKVKQIAKFLKKIFNGGKTETGAADFFIKSAGALIKLRLRKYLIITFWFCGVF